jgi:hypothetical protein
LTTLFALSLVPIVNLNVERLAEAKGWDTLLSDNWGVVMSNLSQLATEAWLLVLMGFLAGGTLFMWGDYLLRHRSAVKANIEITIDEAVEVIREAYYKHETVVLDGRVFVKCVFDGATLVYNGGYVDLVQCTVRFSDKIGVSLMSNSTPITRAMTLAAKIIQPQQAVTVDGTGRKHTMLALSLSKAIPNQPVVRVERQGTESKTLP